MILDSKLKIAKKQKSTQDSKRIKGEYFIKYLKERAAKKPEVIVSRTEKSKGIITLDSAEYYFDYSELSKLFENNAYELIMNLSEVEQKDQQKTIKISDILRNREANSLEKSILTHLYLSQKNQSNKIKSSEAFLVKKGIIIYKNESKKTSFNLYEGSTTVNDTLEEFTIKKLILIDTNNPLEKDKRKPYIAPVEEIIPIKRNSKEIYKIVLAERHNYRNHREYRIIL